ncbi:hypothetical protein V2G26_017336 [Clonostachys chloroleuca]
MHQDISQYLSCNSPPFDSGNSALQRIARVRLRVGVVSWQVWLGHRAVANRWPLRTDLEQGPTKKAEAVVLKCLVTPRALVHISSPNNFIGQ